MTGAERLRSMKSGLIKIVFELIDTIYMLIGSILIIVAYIYFGNGLMGMPASPWMGLLGVLIVFIVLLLPYYIILKSKYNKRSNKDA